MDEQTAREMFATGPIRKVKRQRLYRLLKAKYGGVVICFVCKYPVSEHRASLEHIVPQLKGGTDDLDNLSISHKKCNMKRGNSV